MTSRSMTNNLAAIALGAAAFTGTAAALASGPAHHADTESGTVYHGTEYRNVQGKLARVDVWNLRGAAPAAPAPCALSDWERAGGESGWQLRAHRFDFLGGRFVHADSDAHGTPCPGVAASGSLKPLYESGS